MKKYPQWFILWLMLALWLGVSQHALHAESVMYVKNPRVNLRSSPATSSENIVNTVPKDTQVTVIQRQGPWYEVRLPDGQQGWISQWVLTAPETVPQSRPQVLSTQSEEPFFPFPSPPQSVRTDEMIYVPAGTYVVGSSQAEIQQVSTKWNAKIDMFTDELSQKQVTIPGFYIDTYEVTNAQYYEFVKATRYPPPPYWSDGFYPAGTEDQPVTFVTWEDAAAYAQWAGKRLPTAEEWEIAARGRTGRLFPWGSSYAKQKVNLNYAESGIAPVGSSPEDVSEIGVYDLGGNVMEWTMTQYSDKNDFFVVKGGSWVSEPFVARGANNTPSHVEYRLDHLGFRCVKSEEGKVTSNE